MDVLRETARSRVQSSSLRAVAEEIGVAHTTLAAFIKGAEPIGRTLKKLQAWYTDEANEVLRLRRENAALRKRVAELERELRERR